KATRLVARIQKELNLTVPLTQIFNTPRIRDLAQCIQGLSSGAREIVQCAEKREYYRLSSAQKRLFFLQQMEETGTGYNMPSVMRLEGPLQKKKLETTFKRLIQRHESLRTSFKEVAEEPVQEIHDTVEFTHLYREAPSGAAARSITTAFFRPFDLSRAPLLRVGIIKLAEETHQLLLDMHHIISDGHSLEILIKEFTDIYREQPLLPLTHHYKDYALWSRGKGQRETLKSQEAYWLNRFSEENPVLEMISDYPRPRIRSFYGHRLDFEITPIETGELKALALREETTVYK
ncbi:MAG: non-ribosomal peptide synthetase, partial [bacterium]|nr:non-ribosomal peptide synthetase [bacterium]